MEVPIRRLVGWTSSFVPDSTKMRTAPGRKPAKVTAGPVSKKPVTGLVEGSPRVAGLRLEQFVEDEVVLVAGTNPTFRNYQRLAATATTAQDL
jgi:hypothetical protein